MKTYNVNIMYFFIFKTDLQENGTNKNASDLILASTLVKNFKKCHS